MGTISYDEARTHSRNRSIRKKQVGHGISRWRWADGTNSLYEAAYLKLALRHCLSLASLDKTLMAAARAAGVPTYKP